jgi:hypothetical protein
MLTFNYIPTQITHLEIHPDNATPPRICQTAGCKLGGNLGDKVLQCPTSLETYTIARPKSGGKGIYLTTGRVRISPEPSEPLVIPDFKPKPRK